MFRSSVGRGGYFNAVAIGVEHFEFVIAIAGEAGASQNAEACLLKESCLFIHFFGRRDAKRHVNEAGMLCHHRVISVGRNARFLHQFQPGTRRKTQEVAFETRGRVPVFGIAGGAKVLFIKGTQFLQAVGVNRNVVNGHGPKRWQKSSANVRSGNAGQRMSGKINKPAGGKKLPSLHRATSEKAGAVS